MFASVQGAHGNVEVASVGRCDHDQIQRFLRQERVDIANDFGMGIFLPGFITVPLDDVG